MTPTEPLQLHHSWPLTEVAQRLDEGRLLDAGDAIAAPVGAVRHRGLWTCDLSDDRLHWSPEVYRLFGLSGRAAPIRQAAVALYAEDSRAAMERLRAYAIRHRRGFTLDVRILPTDRAHRWLRLIAVPMCADGKVVRLHGSKTDVSHLYAQDRSTFRHAGLQTAVSRASGAHGPIVCCAPGHAKPPFSARHLPNGDRP